MLMFKKDFSYGKAYDGCDRFLFTTPRIICSQRILFVLSCLKTVEVSSIWKTFLRYSDIYKDI